MTIVASNSITVSKVDDGTITHTAWSYSADGTDRFTTVYPNLNLLKGSSKPFIMGYGISNTTWDTTNQVSKISLPVTAKNNEVLPQGIDFHYTYTPGVTYTQSIYISTDAPLTGIPISFTWWTGPYGHNTEGVDKLVKVSTNIYIATSTYTWPSSKTPVNGRNADLYNLTEVFDFTKGTFLQFYKPKLEPSSIATPYMLSSSEVTTADWPKYIGHYTDFMQADSTNPSDYTWGPMRGDDGVGVTSTVITYAISTSGTTAPSTGWTSSVPSLVKGQYLWTKTVWTYTDNSSETAYSVSYNSKDGTNGTNGTSGIIVSSVAPASPQNGQLWQDTSTTPQLVKKWTGSEWVIWELYVENMNVNNLSALSPNLGNITGGNYTSWSSETVNGILYLNGIYLYNGRIRSLNIQAPSSIDPDKKGQLSGKNCRGTEVYSGDTHLFDSVIPQLSTASPNDILKGNEFWDKTSIFTYCGKISGYRTDGTPHTKYSSKHHIFEGTLQAKSMSGNVGGIVLSQGSFPVNVTPNNSLKTEWGNEFSSLKLYGQVVGRRQFTLEINLDYVQELPNPDIGYRPYTASTIIGSLGEGVNNREWMVVAGITAPRNDLLFRTYYRDGNGNWNENSSTSSYIYLIVPMIY